MRLYQSAQAPPAKLTASWQTGPQPMLVLVENHISEFQKWPGENWP